MEKKRLANFIANKLSGLLYGKAGQIVEACVAPETLRDFHLKNPEDTKITFFDNVDIPNVDKLSLYGPDLIGTTYFENTASMETYGMWLRGQGNTATW